MSLVPVHPTNLPQYKNHKIVVKFENREVGLKGFVAIHNNNLGTAVGGTRMYPYKTEEEALIDVLRLSEAMTYKCALAGVPHGGGKAVIIADPQKDKTPDLIREYAKQIDELQGQFYTGEDVGISEEDVQLMFTVSPYFIGKSGLAGDPSPYASLSTYYAMKKAVSVLTKKNSLQGLTIGVKGVGKVGGGLVDLLIKDKVKLLIADINPQAVEKIKQKYPDYIDITVFSPEDILKQEMDVYAPCAMGNEFTSDNIGFLKTKLICGGANNQLATKEIGTQLFKEGIFYIPDYVANSGGLINVVDELESGGYKKERVLERVENVENVVEKILKETLETNSSPNEVADKLAENIFQRT